MAGNAGGALDEAIGVHIGDDGLVGDIFDQAGAEDGRGNTEDDVIESEVVSEIRLLKVASAGIGTARNDEEVMHAAIGRVTERAVGIEEELEARFANRAIGCDERRE